MLLPRKTVFSVLVLSTALALVSCSGGDAGPGGGGPGGGAFLTTVTGLDTSRSGQGVVGIQLTVQGPAGESFLLAPTYELATGGALPATAVSDAQAAMIGLPTVFPPNLIGTAAANPITVPSPEGSTGLGTLQLVFWWAAGQDLGFLSASNATVNAQVLDPMTNAAIGEQSSTPLTQVVALALPLVGSSGRATGNVPGNPTSGATQDFGRAGQRSEAVSSGATDDILVTGGFVGSTSPNTYDSADRFAFDTANQAHAVSNLGLANMIGRRALHRTTSFLTVNGGLRVLVSGGVDSVDPEAAIPSVRSRVAGSSITGTGVVFDPSPGANVPGSAVNMILPRFAHTATWTPYDQIAIIGGGTTSGATAAAATNAIEHYDVINNVFFVPTGAALVEARMGHEAALLSDGRIFIVGGEDPARPGVALPCEIYNPATATSTAITSTGSLMTRVNHTATRLFNGWILIIGGQVPATRALIGNAVVFRPANQTFVNITLQEARSLHAATLLGNGGVFVSGGLAGPQNASVPGEYTPTNAIELVTVDALAPFGFTSTIVGTALNEARAEHSATAAATGPVYVIGGRALTTTGITTIDFLESIEVVPFSNTNPFVANISLDFSSTFTQTAPGAGSVALVASVTDADQDGGYVFVRWRRTGNPNGAFTAATITAQSPSSMIDPLTGMMTFPNGAVTPGNTTFVWNFSADGLGRGEAVEIQFLPVGATLGTPTNTTITLP